jgi:hypothetical protein
MHGGGEKRQRGERICTKHLQQADEVAKRSCIELIGGVRKAGWRVNDRTHTAM